MEFNQSLSRFFLVTYQFAQFSFIFHKIDFFLKFYLKLKTIKTYILHRLIEIYILVVKLDFYKMVYVKKCHSLQVHGEKRLRVSINTAKDPQMSTKKHKGP
jgi:hypothetical protein